MAKQWKLAILALAGLLFAASLPMTMRAQETAAAKEKVLYSFPGTVSDGIFPYGGIVHDSAGNFYGTTDFGGITNGGYCSSLGCGTVFKIDSAGTETVLYSFTGTNGDGAAPQAALVLDSAGNLYGTTNYGGNVSFPAGTVFKIDSAGKEKILHSFNLFVGDGQSPTSTLTRDSAGNLYGTTTNGGTNNAGLIFEVKASGGYSVLYKFTGPDGANPYRSRLLRDSAGDLFGLTNNGGASGYGVLFELSATGQETVLYSFAGGNDGANPLGDLVQDSSGNFYGVTSLGGANGNGVVFKVDSTGQQTLLYTFAAGLDGQPLSGVVLDSAGNLYGTTTLGGSYHKGSVFKLDSAGTLTTLHSFTDGADGGRPYGNLLLGGNGILYGTTVDGGTSQAGALFELKP